MIDVFSELLWLPKTFLQFEVVLQARSLKTAGIVKKISLENFLCHDKLEVKFNEQINFIIGNTTSLIYVKIFCLYTLIVKEKTAVAKVQSSQE